MNNVVEHTERHSDPVAEPLSVSHLVKTIHAYLPVIGISLLSVAIGYTVFAIVIYLMSPTQRTTTQPFRLEFRGATEGQLPSGVRFSVNEIVGTPVLLRVYQADQLDRYMRFNNFSRSVFILEANPAYERLVSEYQARLSDPKLSPPDRDRLQKEFEAKRDALKKSDYSINYLATREGGMPDSLVRKVLVDILNNWANIAINEQHALDYRVAILSPSIIEASGMPAADPVIAIQVLRSKIYRVIDNLEEIAGLPGAELARTSDRLTLAEIRMRLEDIVRFRLEPLVGVARASGLVKNPVLTVHFIENQLAYDQRHLQAARAHANAARDALLMYNNDLPAAEPTAAADRTAVRSARGNTGAEGETVMPQLSDSFLDRLVSLSRQAIDAEYRKKLIDDYRKAVDVTIPLEQAVAYQEQLLTQFRGGGGAAPSASEQTVQQELAASTAEVRAMIVKLNELYQVIARNLNPSTQLYSVTAPPATRIEHSRSLRRLALYGVVVLLISLPLVVFFCLLHNRMREEEAAEVDRMITPAEEPA